MSVRPRAGAFHMGIAKRLLYIYVSTKDDWREYLVDFEGSREEALQAIRDDPREVFCSCTCPKDERGACMGVA